METRFFIAVCILVGVVVSFFSAFIRSMNRIESRIEDLKPKENPNWDYGKITVDNAKGKTENGINFVRFDSGKENKDEIELRKYCLNNVPAVIGKKSYISEADMIYHYITTGETKKGSDTSKKQEL